MVTFPTAELQLRFETSSGSVCGRSLPRVNGFCWAKFEKLLFFPCVTKIIRAFSRSIDLYNIAVFIPVAVISMPSCSPLIKCHFRGSSKLGLIRGFLTERRIYMNFFSNHTNRPRRRCPHRWKPMVHGWRYCSLTPHAAIHTIRATFYLVERNCPIK